MKRILFVFVLCLTLAFNVSASHIYGGELLYSNISGNSYTITLVLYGDCSANPSTFAGLYTATPAIGIYNNQTLYANVSLVPEPGTGYEVTPACSAQINNTACNGGTLPGIKKFVYTKTISLSGTSSNWRFVFNGNLASGSQAGRSNNITNVAGVGSTLITLEATLDNTNGANSSPQYTTIPTPFFCVNTAQQYNQGAIDPNADSLMFALTPALNNGPAVTYIAPYTATTPMSTQAGSFTFNAINGQMSFTPDQQQDALVVNKVYEYRNGVVVGTSMREMTFIVFNNCNNHPPSGNVSGTITGGASLGPNIVGVCQGSSLISFSISPTDPDGDTINLTATGIPANATLNIVNNNTPTPTLSFTWNTTNIPPGNYSFFITYKDNGCPLSAQQTQAYTVRIVNRPTATMQVLSPTQCDHKALVQFNLINGLLPRTAVITQNGNTISSHVDSTGIITDSLAAGTYTLTLNSQGFACATVQTFVINDSGMYPHSPTVTSPVYYCKNDTAISLTATSTQGATLNWYDPSGSLLASTPTPSTNVPGIFTWLVSQTYDVCESAKDTVQVYVTERPIASFSAPTEICTVDTAQITFTGSAGSAAIYNWNWSNAQYISGTNAGPYSVHWDTAGIKTISLKVVENQCPSVVSTVALNVKPTPKAIFSYKNICEYDSIAIQYNTAPLPGAQYLWDFANGITDQNTGIGPHIVHWSEPGDKSIGLQVSLNGCMDTARNTMTVYPQPTVAILNKAEKLCYGDKIYLETKASGGGTFQYTWTPKAYIFTDPDGTIYTRVLSPGTYVVKATNEYNCSGVDSIRYDDVEPCCNFSYPDAFTPNGDGTNDRFHVVTYGNDLKYDLQIYNRWGQKVFESFNQLDEWDGTLNGKPCEMGTYYYFFKAKCMTGQNEERKGEITLIR